MSDGPIWFGRRSRALFGWLHQPPAGAGAAVVLCPPVGIEAEAGRRALRRLAATLEPLGIASLRFDYTATGDSAGHLGELVSASIWIDDVAAAIDQVRGLGAGPVGVVGLRLGALLSGLALVDNSVADALVLWDPYERGRDFLRHQRLLAAVIESHGAVENNDEVHLPAMSLSRRLADSVAKLELTAPPKPLARRLLLVGRSAEPSGEGTMRGLAHEGTDSLVAADEDQFLDVEPGAAILPVETLSRIARWLKGVFGNAQPHATPRRHEGAWSLATVAEDGDEKIREHPIRIEPSGMFGVVTEPADTATVSRSVVLLNAGLISHVGPGRLWVDLARQWARDGIRTLRLDLAGIGDSPPLPGQPRDVVYSRDAAHLVLAAVRYLALEDPRDVVIAGLCSGAYHAAECAIRLGTREVWLLSPGAPDHGVAAGDEGPSADGIRAIRPMGRWARAARANDALVALVSNRLPASAWWLLDRLRLYPLPTRPFELLAKRGVRTLVVCNAAQASEFESRARWSLRRLRRATSFQLQVVESMDHSLFGREGRLAATSILAKRAHEMLLEVPGDAPSESQEILR